MGNDDVQTPTLDQTASEGRLFRRTYSPNPVCSPTRASILTGQYPHVHGEIENHMQLLAEHQTIGEAFTDAGYETGYVGKWHLDGDGKPGYIPKGPRRLGFDYWEGFNRGHDYHRGHPRFTDDGDCYWEEGYQPEVQTDLALDFLETRAAADNPFFLMLSWGPPHTPFDAPDEYSEIYDPDELDLRPNVPDEEDTPELRRDLAEYYALITSLDDQFERLLDALDRHDVADDTVVVFVSDHGEMLGSQGRQRKNYPFEESVQVPLIIRYPDRVEPGEADALVNLVDLMPTLLGLCIDEVPRPVQGRDLSGYLRGEKNENEAGHDALYIEGQLPYDETWRTIRTRRYMLTVDRRLDTRYFFDMRDDPYQQKNLAGTAEAADIEQELRERLINLGYDYDDRYLIAKDIASDVHANPLDPRGDIFDSP